MEKTEKKVTKKPAVAKKEKVVETAVKAPEVKPVEQSTRAAKYLFTIGRRKTATARVKFWDGGSGKITVNTRTFESYFPTEMLQKIIMAPLVALGREKTIDAEIQVAGGGTHSQADAVALGLSRAFVDLNHDSKTVLKKQGLMTRDARKKERKKPGLKRARRAPQWQKR